MMAYDHEKTPLSECLKIESALTSDVHSKARLDAWVEHAKLLERDARRYYFLRDADDVPVSFGKQFDEDCDSAMRGSAYDASRPSKGTHPQPVTPAGGEVEPTDQMVDAFHAGSGLGRYWPEARNGLRSAMHYDPRFTHPPVADAALLCFVAGVMDEWYEGDLDGGDRQDLALKYGLLDEVRVTEACGDLCQCAEYGDFPQMCNQPSPLLKRCRAEREKPARAAIDAALNQRGGGDHG